MLYLTTLDLTALYLTALYLTATTGERAPDLPPRKSRLLPEATTITYAI